MNGWVEHVPGPAPTPPTDVEVSQIVEVQLAGMDPSHSYYDFLAGLAWGLRRVPGAVRGLVLLLRAVGMRYLAEPIAALLWIVGVVLALTTFAVLYAWYLVLERALLAWGLV